jgi:hypothetical protein
MKDMKRSIWMVLGVGLIATSLYYYGRTISESGPLNALGDKIFNSEQIARSGTPLTSTNSSLDANSVFDSNNTNLPARPNQKVFSPINITLLEKEDIRFRSLLKNKDASWLQVRKQQAKIQMLKKKFAIPLLNHEKWPETVLLYLIQKENYQVDEINKAQNIEEFNLTKKDIENLSKNAN